jgi:hypothetical protein
MGSSRKFYEGGNYMTSNECLTPAAGFWNVTRRFFTQAVAAGLLLGVMTVPAVFAQNWVLAPLYGSSAGVIGQLAMTTLKTNMVVTAVSTTTNNLEVIAWNDTGTKLARTGSATGDVIFPLWGVAITALDSGRVVTAAANWNTSDLELTVWKVSLTGAVSRQGKIATGGLVTGVSIATLDSGRVVTAVQNSKGNLTLKVWKITSAGVITSEGGFTVNTPATSIALVGLNASQMVTAFRNGKGNLELISWSIDGSGNLTRQGTATGGAVAKVSIAYWGPNIVTAVETEKAELGFETWSIDASGGMGSVFSTTAGSAYGVVALCMFPTQPHTPLPFTAVENSSYGLSLAAWYVVPNSGGYITELASYNGGAYVGAQLAVASEGPGRPYFVVTAVKNKSSNLVLRAWQLYQTTTTPE